jgi:valyl-tRNA synthetase
MVMKKQIYTLLTFLLVAMYAGAQSYGELEWQKKKIPAMILEVPYTASVTEDAIRQKFSQMGYSAKESKGVYTYKAVRIPEIQDETFDVLLKVDRKSRKEKDESNIYFVVARGAENFVKSTDDPVLIAKIKQYVLGFIPLAEAQALEVEIKDQEDKVKSNEKKLKDYEDESGSLERKKKKLEDDIEENKKNIEKQKGEVENQRKALDVLRAKRKTA